MHLRFEFTSSDMFLILSCLDNYCFYVAVKNMCLILYHFTETFVLVQLRA